MMEFYVAISLEHHTNTSRSPSTELPFYFDLTSCSENKKLNTKDVYTIDKETFNKIVRGSINIRYAWSMYKSNEEMKV